MHKNHADNFGCNDYGIWIFAEPLVGIFSAGNEKIQQIALSGFRIFAINYLVVRNEYFASGLFTALNNGKISAVISVARTACFRVCRNADFADVYRHKRCMVGIARCRIVCRCNFRNIYNCQCKKIPSGRWYPPHPRSCRQFIILKAYHARV